MASVHRFYYSDTDELDVELFSWWADELVVWFSTLRNKIRNLLNYLALKFECVLF